jgi:XRE family aerobic/anaerobic benzoate catabolism transcriptional regulator
MSDMHYSADGDDSASRRREPLLRGLGAAVRARRNERALTLRELAARAKVSERFLVQLETGVGNISVARLQDVAEALDTSAAQLLAQAALQPETDRKAASGRPRVVALLGLRGAGKSTIGAKVARKLKVPFVELDVLVAEQAGMSLSTIFEMHGEAYFRRLERDVLRKFLASPKASKGAVLATGGSIVNDPDTYELLKQRAITVWLKARARDHWDRVVAQGDVRPMRGRANAMSELKSLLKTRKPLYEQAAHVIDTSSLSLDDAVERVAATSRPNTTTKTKTDSEVRS